MTTVANKTACQEETLTCKRCARTFHWTPDSMELRAGWVDLFRPKQCPPCSKLTEQEEKIRMAEQEAREARRRTDAALAELDLELGRRVPARYLETDTGDPRFNTKLWEAAREWRATAETPWIGLVGPSGKGKTRIATLILREIARRRIERKGAKAPLRYFDPPEYPDFKFLPGHRIATLAVSRFASREEHDGHSPHAELEELRQVPLLLLDDIGKIRLSPAVAAEFFGIIDHRHAHNLAMVWTANLPPATLFASLPEDMAGPLTGRFHDCSKIFTVR